MGPVIAQTNTTASAVKNAEGVPTRNDVRCAKRRKYSRAGGSSQELAERRTGASDGLVVDRLT